MQDEGCNDFDLATVDLTNSTAAANLSHYLKIYNERVESQNGITIKQCHTLRQAFTLIPFDAEETQATTKPIDDLNTHRSGLQ